MPSLRVSNFLRVAGPVIASRGMQYWKSGRVEVIDATDGRYEAIVRGSRPYVVKVALSGDDVTSHSCNCPYDGILCKHEVALLMEIRDRLGSDGVSNLFSSGKADKSSGQKFEIPAPGRDSGFELGGMHLSERELFLLCVLVCGGSNSVTKLSYLSSSSFTGKKITASERDSIFSGLVKAGIVSSKTLWNGKYFSLQARYCYPLLKKLVCDYGHWVDFVIDVIGSSDRERYLVDVARVLLGKKERIENNWSFLSSDQEDNWYVLLVLKGAMLQEEGSRLLSLLDRDNIMFLLHLLTDDGIHYCQAGILDRVRELIDLVGTKGKDFEVVCQHHRLAHFLMTGELPQSLDSPTVSSYHCYTRAIASLYEGRTDEAISFFSKGLGVKKGGKVWKTIPQDLPVFLLYVIALGIRRSVADQNALSRILEYKNKPDVGQLRPVFVLAEFFQSNKQPKNTGELLYCLNWTSPEYTCLREAAALILAFFKSEDLYQGTLPHPRMAVLQKEMSAFGHCECGSWPYGPLLANVRVHEFWELELQDLINDAAALSDTANGEAVQTGRLAYVASKGYRGFEITEIREQNRLKSGAWGKGKKVTFSRYVSGDVAMDDIDRKIFNSWGSSNDSRKYYGEFPSLSLVIPFLTGTDKLLRDTPKGVEPVSIREEQPFLCAERRDDRIEFGSNLPKGAEEVENGLIDCSKKGEWVYYPMPHSSGNVIGRLLGLKSIPAAAEPMLEQLFSAVKGKVEIHSEIAGAADMQKVEGQCRMILRVMPEGGLFRAVLLLFPLEGGSRSVFPGTGSQTVYDSIDTRRLEVVRDLKKERRVLNELNALLSEHMIDGFSADSQEALLGLEQLLEVLEIRSSNEGLFDIEWPQGKPFNVLKADAGKWEVSASGAGGWFELEGEIPLAEGHIVTMAQLLALVRESDGRFIRLGEGEFLRLGESLRRQLQRIDAVAQCQGGKVRISEVAMAVGGESLQGELEITEPESVIRMRRRIRESETMEVSIPQGLNATLRDYQEDGVRWMLRMAGWGAGVCLADDMGLGKTLQTIACMLSRKDLGAQMVVAPASVVGNWLRETNRFAPSLNVVMLNELTMDSRGEAISSLGAGDLLVLTYGLLVTECDALTGREWTTVCLDEAHTIKNRDTKSSGAAMRLKADFRIILTGTPIQNHLGELWNLMQFINPGLLGSYDHFNDRFIGPIGAGRQEPRSQLKILIAPFMLRRTKQEVARELPDKEEIVVPVSLSDEELSVYEVIRRAAKSELESSSVVNVNALAMITRLREAACSASLVEKHLDTPSSKLSVMVDKLQQIIGQGNKVLVFSQFTSFLDMAAKELEAAGISDYYYLNGSTPVRERQRMVEDFQKGQKRVFLISLKAGGLGLNLTGANYVIHLDPWWNPAIEQQATDRAYRIGQKQKVTVYHLISEHTIEEKILRLHETKRSLADSLLQGTDMSHKLTAADLLAMIG